MEAISSAGQSATAELPTLIASLLKHVIDRPDAPAVVQRDITVTYGQLADQVQRLSTSLFDIGVKRGDRIVVHLGNCCEAAIACYAAMMLGAIAVPLNIHYKPYEIARLMRRLRPAVYVGHSAQRKVMDEVAADLLPIERRFYVDDTWHALIASAREARPFPDPDPDATALLICTSGTTGEPKLVAHAQRSLAQAIRYMLDTGFDRSTRPLSPTPLFHMSGTFLLFTGLSAGACIVLPSCAYFDADAFLDAIEQHRCTNVAVSPFGAAEMIRAQSARRRGTDSLRLCVVAGDACSVEIQQRFERTFGIPLLCRFGMTEGLACVLPGRTTRTMRARPGSARIVGSNGNDVPIGTPGELCLNTNTLFQGYWISPGIIDTARDADGWFHTGDLVHEDEHGDLHYLSRVKEIIVHDGENIAPAEIEQTLLAHPAAADAAVVGVPDDVLGERIVGFVSLAEHALDTTAQEILAWLATRLADYKLPEALLKVDHVPRTVFGKADRRALRALALASTELAQQRERHA
jgi:long-chain acyl-CoA synthetase